DYTCEDVRDFILTFHKCALYVIGANTRNHRFDPRKLAVCSTGKELRVLHRVWIEWVEYHPDRDPVGQKAPYRSPERYSPVPRHYKPDNHLENPKEHPDEGTDMPDKIDLFSTHLQEHTHHQATVAFHLAHYHFTHIYK